MACDQGGPCFEKGKEFVYRGYFAIPWNNSGPRLVLCTCLIVAAGCSSWRFAWEFSPATCLPLQRLRSFPLMSLSPPPLSRLRYLLHLLPLPQPIIQFSNRHRVPSLFPTATARNVAI